MRYIIIPDSINVSVTITNDGKQENRVVPYGLNDLNAQEVWTNEMWHQDLSSIEAFERIYLKFKGKKPGQVVPLEDADYERYMPLATMRGVKIRPDLAYEMHMLMKAVHAASSTEPAQPAQEPKKKVK